MPNLFSNNAVGFLASTVNTTQIAFLLEPGQGAAFPNVSAADDNYFYVTLVQVDAKNKENGWEIVKIFDRINDSFGMHRAQMGTTALSFGIGNKVSLRLTADHVNNFTAAYDWGDHSAAGYNNLAEPQTEFMHLSIDGSEENVQAVVGKTHLLWSFDLSNGSYRKAGNILLPSVPATPASNGLMFKIRDPMRQFGARYWELKKGNASGANHPGNGISESFLLDVAGYQYDFVYLYDNLTPLSEGYSNRWWLI